MKKWILAALIILAVVIFVYLVRTETTATSILSSGKANTSQTNINSTSEKITIVQLSQHNSQSDCWVGYEEKIYDITSFLPKHPGSAAAIVPYCGTEKEFTTAFIAQHGTTKVNLLMKVGVFIGDFNIVGKTQ